MFKYIAIVTLFAVVSAQNWQWPQHPIAPLPIEPRPPTWNDPQPPMWNVPQPNPPTWNPQGPEQNWSRPSERPTHPINTQGRQGVRDARCPAINGDNVVLFPHDRFCSQYFICNHGSRFTFDCPRGQTFDRFNLVCDFNGRC